MGTASVAVASDRDSSSARCGVIAQTLTSFKNISCRQARSAYQGCVRAGCKGPAMECRGRRTRWNGWTITGIGRGGQAVKARWSKGGMSFVASGGGLC